MIAFSLRAATRRRQYHLSSSAISRAHAACRSATPAADGRWAAAMKGITPPRSRFAIAMLAAPAAANARWARPAPASGFPLGYWCAASSHTLRAASIMFDPAFDETAASYATLPHDISEQQHFDSFMPLFRRQRARDTGQSGPSIPVLISPHGAPRAYLRASSGIPSKISAISDWLPRFDGPSWHHYFTGLLHV